MLSYTESIDVKARKNDKFSNLKFIGDIIVHQSGIDIYWVSDKCKEMFYTNSLGIQLHLIAYGSYLITENIFDSVTDSRFRESFKTNLDFIRNLVKKWFEDEHLLSFEIFPFYQYDNFENWEMLSEFEYINRELSVEIKLSTPYEFMGEPIFIREEYYKELKNDLDKFRSLIN